MRSRCLPEAGKGLKGRQKAPQLGQQVPLCYRVPEPPGKETGVRTHDRGPAPSPSPGDLPSNKTGHRSGSQGTLAPVRLSAKVFPVPVPGCRTSGPEGRQGPAVPARMAASEWLRDLHAQISIVSENSEVELDNVLFFKLEGFKSRAIKHAVTWEHDFFPQTDPIHTVLAKSGAG